MWRLLISVLFFLAPTVWAAEPEPDVQTQLTLVQTRKGIAQSEIDRGRLMVENGQLWLEKFTAEEKRLQAEIDKAKTPPPDPSLETSAPAP